MLNQCTFVGYLGDDAKPIANGGVFLSLAVPDTWINKQGQKVEHTNWLPVLYYGKSTEHLKKGTLVTVTGKLRTTTKKEGNSYINEFSVLAGYVYYHLPRTQVGQQGQTPQPMQAQGQPQPQAQPMFQQQPQQQPLQQGQEQNQPKQPMFSYNQSTPNPSGLTTQGQGSENAPPEVSDDDIPF